LMPGGSIGTLTVNGNLTFQPGSFYAINLAPTQHSQTNVIGNATINGGSVVLDPQLGNYGTNKIAILTATGGVTGTFNPTLAYSSTLNLRGALLTYDANDVYLSFGAVTLASPASDRPMRKTSPMRSTISFWPAALCRRASRTSASSAALR
jgi:outer membrane autotransporter protein